MNKVSILCGDIRRFLEDEKAYYKSYSKELTKNNLKILKKMDVMHLLAIVLYWGTANLLKADFSFNGFVAVCLIIQIIYCGFIHFYTARKELPFNTFQGLYLILSLLVVTFSMGNSIFTDPDTVSVTFFPLLVSISLLYKVPSLIIVPVLTIYAGIFLVLVWQLKPYEIAVLDTQGVLLAYIVSLIGVYASAKFNIADYKSKKQLERLSSIDSLTHIYNKSYFTRQCESYLENKKALWQSALFIMDLDNFKLVNDIYGHKKGDYVLGRFGELIKRLLEREGDNVFAGRFGGDEFVVFFKQIGKISIIEEYAYEILKGAKGLNDELEHVNMSCSIGIAISSQTGESYEKLFYEADKALYESKNSGKNTMTISYNNRKTG